MNLDLFWCFWGILLEYERKISTQKWVVTWTYHKVATENAAHDAKNHGILGSMVCNSQAPEPTCGQHYNTIGLYLQMIRHVYAYIYIYIYICVCNHHTAWGCRRITAWVNILSQNRSKWSWTYPDLRDQHLNLVNSNSSLLSIRFNWESRCCRGLRRHWIHCDACLVRPLCVWDWVVWTRETSVKGSLSVTNIAMENHHFLS